MQIIDTRHTAVRHAVPIEEIKNEESVAAEHKDIVESSDPIDCNTHGNPDMQRKTESIHTPNTTRPEG